MDKFRDKLVRMHLPGSSYRSDLYSKEIFFRGIIFLDGYFIALP